MATKEKKNDSLNSIRTTLLLLANNELSFLRKNNKTKINSKKIIEAEKYYSSANNYLIKLKEENFVPNFITREVIQNNNFKSKFSFGSPDVKNIDFIRKSGFLSKDNHPFTNSKNNPGIKFENLNDNFQLDLLLFSKKSDVSSKKNEYFKIKTLKITSDDIKINENVNNFENSINKPKRKSTIDLNYKNKNINIEKKIDFINNYNNNLNDIKTKMTTEKAFNYLQNLAKELKIINKKKKNYKLDYDEMTRAISEKDVMKDKNLNNNNNIFLNESNKNILNDNIKNNIYDIGYDKDSFYEVNKKEEKNNRSEEKREKKNDQDNNFLKLFSLNLICNNEKDNLKLKKIKSEKKLERNRGKRGINLTTQNNINDKKSNLIELNKCLNSSFKINDVNFYENKYDDGILDQQNSQNFMKETISDNSFEENKNSSNSNKSNNNDNNTPKSNTNSNNIYDSNINNNKLSLTISRNNSFSNSTEKFNNIVLISAAQSFKSINKNSFKIQLKTIEDERNKSMISYNNDNENNENNKNIINNSNIESEYKKLKYIDIKPIHKIEFPQVNNFPNKLNCSENDNTKKIENIYDNQKISFKENINNQEKFIKMPQKLHLEKITATENKNFRKNSSLYFNSSDNNTDNSDDDNKKNIEFYSKVHPLSERKTSMTKIEAKKIFKMKEINFLNSIDIKQKKYKSILDSDKSSKIKNHYLHSTDTSSFIQLKKIQNEEYSNSREKIDQSKLINLITNENDDEINENFDNNIIDESKINNNNDIIKLNKIPFYPKSYNRDNNMRNSNNELKVVKLLKCKTSEDFQEFGNNQNVLYQTNEFMKSEEENINFNENINNKNIFEKSVEKNYKEFESGINNNQIMQINNDSRDCDTRSGNDNQKLKHSKTLYYKKGKIKNKINSEDNLKAKYLRSDILNKDDVVKATKINKVYENNIILSNSNKLSFKAFNDENMINKFDADDYYNDEYKIAKRFSFNKKHKFENISKNNFQNEQINYYKENKFEIKKPLIQLNLVGNFLSEQGGITERYSKEKRKMSYNKSSCVNREKTDFKIKLHECNPINKNIASYHIKKKNQNENI